MGCRMGSSAPPFKSCRLQVSCDSVKRVRSHCTIIGLNLCGSGSFSLNVQPMITGIHVMVRWCGWIVPPSSLSHPGDRPHMAAPQCHNLQLFWFIFTLTSWKSSNFEHIKRQRSCKTAANSMFGYPVLVPADGGEDSRELTGPPRPDVWKNKSRSLVLLLNSG